MKKLILFISCLVLLLSCKNNKPVAAENAESRPVPPSAPVADQESAPPKEKVQPDTFRVVISFISIGEGTDPEGPAKVERVLKSWENKKGTAVTYTVQPWGREGEADYNFTLRGMSAPDQQEFVKQLQSALKDEKLIIVTENKPNRFKR